MLGGRAYDSEGVPPYLPFVEVLRAFMRDAPTDRLRAHLGTDAADITALLPELRNLMPGLPSGTPAGSDQDRHRLFEAVCDALDAIARSGETGLLLVLDDLHWADAPTLALVQHLVRRLAGAPLLLVIAFRTTEAEQTPAFIETLAVLAHEGAAAPLTLAPLAMDETQDLASGIAGVAVATQVAAAVHRTTEGNPFFISEVVRSLQAEGRDLNDSQTASGDLTIPDLVRQVIAARLGRLRPATNDLLRYGAVLGDGFTFEIVAAAGGLDADTALVAIEEAMAADMLRPEGDRYQFAHPLIRRTVYDALSPPRRQRLHLRAAEAIEATHAGSLVPHAAALAAHYRLAGASANPAKAIEYAMLVGEAARSVFAFEEAVAHWRWALERLEAQGAPAEHRAALLERLADVLYVADVDRDTGFAYLERGMTLYDQAGARQRAAEVRVRLGDYLNSSYLTRDVARSLAYYRAAEPVLRNGPETTSLGYFYLGLGEMSFHRLQVADQFDAVQRALAIGERLSHPALTSEASRHKGYALAGLGRVGEALAVGAQAWHTADRHRAVIPAFWGAIARGIVAVRLLGDPIEGISWYERELAQSRQGQAAHPRRVLLGNSSEACIMRGDLENARRLNAAADGLSALVPASVAFWAGDWDEAARRFDDVCRRMRATGDRWNEWWFTYLFAAACRRTGDAVRARALLEDALAMILEGQHIAMELATRAELALLLAQAGDPDEARPHLERCRAIVAEGEDWRGRAGRVALAEAAVLTAAGQSHEAVGAFAQAVAISRRYGLAWDEAETLHAWGRSLRAAGDHRAGAARIDEAIEIYRRHGAAEPLIERIFAADELALSSQRPTYPDGLTAREVEVLGLLAAGLSNREIAEALVVSVRTIGRHMDNLYGKIGVHERSQARRYARERGIIAPLNGDGA